MGFSISSWEGILQPSQNLVKTAIITGANGFIGSHVVCRLLAQGWTVQALGRGNEAGRWEDRVFAAMREVGSSVELRRRLFCHEVGLSAPELNLDGLFQTASSASEATLFHLAGDTRFRPSNPGIQRRVNVQAPVKLVSALQGRIVRVIHVSTAYVAGKRTQLIRESELDCGQDFWNSYEKSKFDAELALTALCQEQAIPLVIVRPSIIINDRESGRASTFTHLNAMVEVVSRIQEDYGIADGQVVSKTIRLLADARASPNLAAVDSIVPPLLQIAESAAAPGKVFHLCHPRPQPNPEVMSLICEAFQVKDRLALEFVADIPKPMSHTEEMIFRSLKVYAPYLNSRCEFDVSNSRSIVPDYDSFFTPLDVPYLRKVIAFQREHRDTT
jgi:nucleoside-diphosphate-sugar epimerase